MPPVYGQTARVSETREMKTTVSLSEVIFGSYVRVLSGKLKGEVCLWTYSSDLIPLSEPGKITNARYDTSFDPPDVLVEVLEVGTKLTIEITEQAK